LTEIAVARHGFASGPHAPHFDCELTKTKASPPSTAIAAIRSDAQATLPKLTSGKDPIADRLAWMNSDALLEEMHEIDWKAVSLGYSIVGDRFASDRLELRIPLGVNTSEASIRRTFKAALADVKIRQQLLGGKPGQRAPRSDERVERDTFFLWLSKPAPRSGKALTKRAIAELWRDLTKEWSWWEHETERGSSPGIEALPHFKRYPQAAFAFDEWRRNHQRDWPVSETDIALEAADPEVEVALNDMRQSLAAAARAHDNLVMSPGPEETVETMDDERVKQILKRLAQRRASRST
jgi:hypothetical protein